MRKLSVIFTTAFVLAGISLPAQTALVEDEIVEIPPQADQPKQTAHLRHKHRHCHIVVTFGHVRKHCHSHRHNKVVHHGPRYH